MRLTALRPLSPSDELYKSAASFELFVNLFTVADLDNQDNQLVAFNAASN
jgi:hypothetical protein